jgi:NifB/MoaA-like Fe-S oxidoreductase
MGAKQEPNMNDRDELEQIINQLEDLVKVATAAEKNEVEITISSFVDVHKKLMDIYTLIENFREVYRNSLVPFGLTPEDMRISGEELTSLPSRERKMIEKLHKLQSTCEDAKERIHESLQKNHVAAKQVKEELKGSERQKVRRKGKFKGMGGKKGWMPT